MPRTCTYAYTRSSVKDIDEGVARVLAERSASRLKLCGLSIQGRPRPVRPEWQFSQYEIADMRLRAFLCRRPAVFRLVRRRLQGPLGPCVAVRRVPLIAQSE